MSLFFDTSLAGMASKAAFCGTFVPNLPAAISGQRADNHQQTNASGYFHGFTIYCKMQGKTKIFVLIK